MCCSVLQCIAVHCSVFHCVAVHLILVDMRMKVCCSVLQRVAEGGPQNYGYAHEGVLQRAAVRYSVLQCAAVCYSELQCVTACCSVLHRVAVDRILMDMRMEMCCRVLQCVAVHFSGSGSYPHGYAVKVCSSVLQRFAACCSAACHTDE